MDSGASLAMSPFEKDFVGPITYYSSPKWLGGMVGGMEIKGIEKIAWSYKTVQGILTVHSRCYFVHKAAARLLSPQRLFLLQIMLMEFSLAQKRMILCSSMMLEH